METSTTEVGGPGGRYSFSFSGTTWGCTRTAAAVVLRPWKQSNKWAASAIAAALAAVVALLLLAARLHLVATITVTIAAAVLPVGCVVAAAYYKFDEFNTYAGSDKKLARNTENILLALQVLRTSQQNGGRVVTPSDELDLDNLKATFEALRVDNSEDEYAQSMLSMLTRFAKMDRSLDSILVRAEKLERWMDHRDDTLRATEVGGARETIAAEVEGAAAASASEAEDPSAMTQLAQLREHAETSGSAAGAALAAAAQQLSAAVDATSLAALDNKIAELTRRRSELLQSEQKEPPVGDIDGTGLAKGAAGARSVDPRFPLQVGCRTLRASENVQEQASDRSPAGEAGRDESTKSAKEDLRALDDASTSAQELLSGTSVEDALEQLDAILTDRRGCGGDAAAPLLLAPRVLALVQKLVTRLPVGDNAGQLAVERCCIMAFRLADPHESFRHELLEWRIWNDLHRVRLRQHAPMPLLDAARRALVGNVSGNRAAVAVLHRAFDLDAVAVAKRARGTESALHAAYAGASQPPATTKPPATRVLELKNLECGATATITAMSAAVARSTPSPAAAAARRRGKQSKKKKARRERQRAQRQECSDSAAVCFGSSQRGSLPSSPSRCGVGTAASWAPLLVLALLVITLKLVAPLTLVVVTTNTDRPTPVVLGSVTSFNQPMDSEAIASVKHAYIFTTSASGALGMCTAEGANVTDSIATITASSAIWNATSESKVPLAEVCIVPGSDKLVMSDVFKVTSGSGTMNTVDEICARNVSTSSADVVQSVRAIVLDKTELATPRKYASVINSSSPAPRVFSEDSFLYAAAEHSRLSQLAPWEIGEIDSKNIMPHRDNMSAVNEEWRDVAIDLIAFVARDTVTASEFDHQRGSLYDFRPNLQQDARVVSDEMSRAQRLSMRFAWCDDFKLFEPNIEVDGDVEGDSNAKDVAKHREGPSSMESFPATWNMIEPTPDAVHFAWNDSQINEFDRRMHNAADSKIVVTKHRDGPLSNWGMCDQPMEAIYFPNNVVLVPAMERAPVRALIRDRTEMLAQEYEYEFKFLSSEVFNSSSSASHVYHAELFNTVDAVGPYTNCVENDTVFIALCVLGMMLLCTWGRAHNFATAKERTLLVLLVFGLLMSTVGAASFCVKQPWPRCDGQLRQYTEATGVANPFDGIDVESNADPTLVDVNGDGKDDLVVGNYAGNIKVWMNSGSDTWPTEATGAANPFDGIDVGTRAAPTLVDVNGDGKNDLVVGNNDGNIKVWMNSGSNTWPTEATGAANPFDGIDVGSYAVPTLVDVNGDGKDDLVVGNYAGNIKVWMNSGSNTWPTQATGVANPFDGIDAGERSAPTLVDVNGDGKDDLVVGNYAGNIKLYSTAVAIRGRRRRRGWRIRLMGLMLEVLRRRRWST